MAVVNSMDDISKLRDDVLYINISSSASSEVVKYFLNNGSKYYYADVIGNVAGYIYVDYDTYFKANTIIKDIVKGVLPSFTKLEIVRYLYIEIAKRVNYDINSIDLKNGVSFCKCYLESSNLWSSLASGKGNNISYTKLFYYLCAMFDISAELVCLNSNSYLGNKVTIFDGKEKVVFLTDLTKDVPYIQAGFKTHCFGSYNENYKLDKKVNYIDLEYVDIIIDKSCREDCDTLTLLKDSSRIINLKGMGQIEMGIVYEDILKKYKNMNLISVNNLYINNKSKTPFILITDDDKHYGYSYRVNSFVRVEDKFLIDGLNNDEIGIYYDEEVPGINCDKESVKMA